MTYLYEGNNQEALKLFDESLKIRKDINDKKGIAWGKYQKGVVYRIEGDYDRALRYFNQSEDLFKGLNDEKGIAEVYHGKGDLYRRQSNLDKALEYYDASMKAIKEHLNHTSTATLISKILSSPIFRHIWPKLCDIMCLIGIKSQITNQDQ